MPDLTDLCFLLQDRLHRQDLAEASAPAVVENSISQYFFRRLKHSEVCQWIRPHDSFRDTPQRTGCSLKLQPVRRIVLYFGGVNYYFVVAALQLDVLATGLISTRPVPR